MLPIYYHSSFNAVSPPKLIIASMVYGSMAMSRSRDIHHLTSMPIFLLRLAVASIGGSESTVHTNDSHESSATTIHSFPTLPSISSPGVSFNNKTLMPSSYPQPLFNCFNPDKTPFGQKTSSHKQPSPCLFPSMKLDLFATCSSTDRLPGLRFEQSLYTHLQGRIS